MTTNQKATTYPPDDKQDRQTELTSRGRGEQQRQDEQTARPDETDTERFFMQQTRLAYDNSTTFMDNSLRRQWEDNLHNFRGSHPSGSKYHTAAYKGRSRLHRPKIRSSIRNHEAAAAAALFTSNDYIALQAQDQNDPLQEASAKIHQELMQYRLSHTLPWFLTTLGAWQDTHVYGVCVSYQEWQYEEKDEKAYEVAYEEDNLTPLRDDTGAILGEETTTTNIIKDRPWVTLVAPENIRFDPNADWRDPIGTSPYVIEQMPMVAQDVLDQMHKIDKKTQAPQWREYTLSQILTAGQYSNTTDNDTTRQAREGRRRQDPIDTHDGNELSIVWIHRIVFRHDCTDYFFYTVGNTLLLTDIEPLEKSWPLPGRPYRIGVSTLEAHRNYPSSSAELGRDLQQSINEMTNQRRDNVNLALNKRYFIKRQKQGAIDLAALQRNVPGGGVMVDDPQDVQVVETRDVTSSAFQEQDRMSVEMDELLGNFSQSSVQSNRKLNETVGGMNLMSSGANMIQELSLRLFIESWLQPVLRDLVALEAMFETDTKILGIAGEKAELFQKYGIDQITDELLEQSLTVKVNVGMGNTSPAQKVEKMALGLNTVLMIPDFASRLNPDEISKEVFGYLGFSDGERFVKPEEEQEPPPPDPMIEVKMTELELKGAIHQDEMKLKQIQLDADMEVRMMELALEQNMKLEDMKLRLGMDERKNQTVRDMAAAREANKRREITLKQETGSGI